VNHNSRAGRYPHTRQKYNYKKKERKKLSTLLINCRSPNKILNSSFHAFKSSTNTNLKYSPLKTWLDLLQSHIHEHYHASLLSIVAPNVHGPHPESHDQELSSRVPSNVRIMGVLVKKDWDDEKRAAQVMILANSE
jgi:hypothetical protein